MKILAINGSHRGRNGCTQILLDKLAEGATTCGAEFETVVLAEQKINRCLACDFCNKPTTFGRCVHDGKDDVKAIFERMRAADIIVYGSPVYVFGVTGLLKTFMDRFNCTGTAPGLCMTKSGLIFHHVDKKVIGKPIVVMTLCANIEQETVKNTLTYFKTFARYTDAPIVGTLVRKMAMQLEKTDEPLVREVLSSFVQAGRELALGGAISRSTEKAATKPLLNVPFLDILMHFPLFKRRAVEQANRGS